MAKRFCHASHDAAHISLLALALGACADEKPDQQTMQDEETAASPDQRAPQEARRQRTLGESESGRINQGPLR